MTRILTVLFTALSLALAGCGSGDTEVGSGGASTTTATAVTDLGAGDCAAHDEAGMCIDDPEESLSGVELPECAPEEDCLTVTKRSEPEITDFAERLRPECDEFQAVVDSLPNGSVTVGQALAILDEVEPAFARWADAAGALEPPPPERADEWRRLLDDVVEMTEAATTYFRAVFVELDPSTPVEEAFADESQLPTDIQSQTEAIEAVDDFLGYRCLN